VGRGSLQVLHKIDRRIAALGEFDVDTPWKKLRAKDKKLVLYGVEKRSVRSNTATATGRFAPTTPPTRAS